MTKMTALLATLCSQYTDKEVSIRKYKKTFVYIYIAKLVTRLGKSEQACINSHCFSYVPVTLCPHLCPIMVPHFRLGLC